jgi:MFS family permease
MRYAYIPERLLTPVLLLEWLRTKFLPLRCHTGINSIVMYGVSLLADLLKSNSALLNILVSVLNIIVTLGCAPLADILGRKVCLLGSIAGMGTSSILLAIGIQQAIPILSAIAVLLFVASFGFGLGPVPFILSSELVGPEAVGATQSWALAANWIATFIVAQFFPLVNEKLGKGVVYFVFAGLAAFFFAFVAWWVPETKGKKDADEVWGRESRRAD